MKMESNNPHRYTPCSWDKTVKIEIEVMLDPVPGAWNKPEDFIKWLFTHTYIQSAEVIVDVSETTVDDYEEIPLEIEEAINAGLIKSQLDDDQINRLEEIL